MGGTGSSGQRLAWIQLILAQVFSLSETIAARAPVLACPGDPRQETFPAEASGLGPSLLICKSLCPFFDSVRGKIERGQQMMLHHPCLMNLS